MTPLTIRKVPASHGWLWIVEGARIFRRDPLQWLLLITILFVGSRILLLIPLAGVLAVLVAPHFLAGLAHGAQALEQGRPLRFGYLVSGFLKGAAPLVTLGGISLVGQLVTMMVIFQLGGEALSGITKTMVSGAATPASVEAMRAAAPQLLMAVLIGLAVSLPVMMAVWFAPLLVFFDEIKPLPALLLSLWACLRNVMPLLIYGMAILAPVMILTPLSMAARMPDLGFWLLAPIMVPSIYASYQNLFVAAPAQS